MELYKLTFLKKISLSEEKKINIYILKVYKHYQFEIIY